MLTTAKSIQLLDASGMNISPITDITSLYYEVENPKDKRIISRKYVYDAFPVGVNINPTALVNIGVSTNTAERHPADSSLYDNGQLYKIVDVSNNDILVSKVDTDIIPGTTLRELKITNYNLSDILSYYTPLDLIDASYGELIEDISVINASIRDVSTRIADLKASLDTSSATLSEIIGWASKNMLIPNKFYLINDYYTGSNGCMALPDSDNKDFSGPDSSSPLSLLVKANDFTNLDGKLYEMYDNDGKALKVHGTYKIENNKVRITYMKDQYGNEAPYDFYNLKYNEMYTFGTNSINSSIQNNIMKTDPFILKSMPYIKYNNGNLITNNYIGYDTSIYVNCGGYILFQNNNIYNNNDISINVKGNLNCKNIIIHQQNNIYATIDNDFNFNNSNINSSNNITLYNKEIINLNINSSNNITLYNDASNVTILNNCDGSINLSDNIIVDNYIDAVTLPTSPNSVYLFGQDVYAKSFNTLKPYIEKTLLYLSDGTVVTIYDNSIT